MHRTQLYLDEELYNEVKQTAKRMNITVSTYIRNVLCKELDAQKQWLEPPDFSEFQEMWKDDDISQESLRSRAWE